MGTVNWGGERVGLSTGPWLLVILNFVSTSSHSADPAAENTGRRISILVPIDIQLRATSGVVEDG
jgi:hypothetical protein